ncbi:MAG: AAA family ATPase [Desulfovibrio sp.]|nr:AAA family ATPase [Desulfovibrio sp.]
MEAGELIFLAPSEFTAAHIRDCLFQQLRAAVHRVFNAEIAMRVEYRPPHSPRPTDGANGATQNANGTTPTPTWHEEPETAPGLALPPAASAEQAGVLAAGRKPACPPSPRPLPALHLPLPGPEASLLTEPSPGPVDASHIWRFSFDDFIVGACNELAHAAARSICHDGRHADALFLCSAPGLGKTHLMHAVGRALCASCNLRKPKVEYLTAEEFTSRFYGSLKSQEIDRFKARYRNADILLLEDVHFLQGKEKTQAELLATVKALREKGSKIVYTSSFAPKDLKLMDEQLQSRLSAGLLSFIERPDEETRRRILRSKATAQQALLPEEVEDILARHIHADVRQIESCLQTLVLKAQLLNTRITPQMAWEVLVQYAAHTPVLDMDAIIGAVCKAFNLTQQQLFSAVRKQEYVRARNTAFYLARKHTDLSFESIGRRFNRRHSTVLKGITSLEREISVQSPEGRQIANILTMIERHGNILSVQ